MIRRSVRIAVLDDYQGVALKATNWSSLGPEVSVETFSDHLFDESDLVARLRGFGIVVVMRERTALPEVVLRQLPNLRLIVTGGLANAAIDMQAARDLQITVAGTRGDAVGTVELTWGLIIGSVRHIGEEDRAIRAGAWQTTMGIELRGSTLGVLGLGRVGEPVARIGRMFGMEVIAWSQNLTAARAHAVGVDMVPFHELLRQADVLTIHLRLSDRTRGLIGESELGLMKRSAFLVNTSRGPIVQEAALLDALRSHRIAGAALDVFDEEPLSSDHPLRSTERLLLTPHLGYVTAQGYRTFFADAVDDILSFLNGTPVRVLT